MPNPGLLGVRRGIPPEMGRLALPGGYVDFGETWQEAASRELWEETGAIVPSDSMTLFWVASSSNRRTMMIFALSPMPQPFTFRQNHEVLEVVSLQRDSDICFPTHAEAVRAWYCGCRQKD